MNHRIYVIKHFKQRHTASNATTCKNIVYLRTRDNTLETTSHLFKLNKTIKPDKSSQTRDKYYASTTFLASISA